MKDNEDLDWIFTQIKFNKADPSTEIHEIIEQTVMSFSGNLAVISKEAY